MATGTLTIRVRPVRIAFLVEPSNTEDLVSAIEANTFLWGGQYNAIIPVFRRVPRKWEPNRMRGWSETPEDIVKGYLDGFDPDFVVPIGSVSKRGVDVGHRDVLSLDELIGDVVENHAPRVGVGMAEVLRGVLLAEFKYQRTDDVQLVFPILPKQFRLFYACVFGSLRKEHEQLLREQIPASVPVSTPKIGLDNYTTVLEPGHIFPRRLSTWSIGERPLHSPTVYLCDASNWLDVLDYWNLRAAGRYVVPIPIQGLHAETTLAFARDFIEENFRPYRNNPEMFHHTIIQKSRTIDDDELKGFVEAMEIVPLDEKKHAKLVLSAQPAPLWNRWARDEDLHFAYSHETETRINDTNKRLDLRSEDPKIELSRHAYSGLPKFANELRFTFYGSKEPLAEVIPEGSDDLAHAIGGVGYNNWRFSARGPVFLAHNAKDLLFVDIPTAESVMTEWLRQRGWQASLSAPGRMALQLYRQLGGAWGISWLVHRGVIPLLGELEKESGLSWAAVTGKLQHIIDAEDLHFSKDRFLEGMIESNAIRLGAAVQCTVCTRHNWYEMDKLRYELQCKFCLSNFVPPLKSPKDIQWTYRAHGPFASSAAQGAFSVLLTLRFLTPSALRSAQVTPLFSYFATKDGASLESDLTCFFKSEQGDTRTHLIHAECKSSGGFEDRDFERMSQLAREFPGAALIFSTLLDKLDAYSVGKLRALSIQHRKQRVGRRPYSPVIILTGNELFALRGAPECWKKFPLYDRVSNRSFSEAILDVWADTTQQLYLDLPNYSEWWNQQRNRRLERLKARADGSTKIGS